MRGKARYFLFAATCCLCAPFICAQGNWDAVNNAQALPVTKISVFSSGLAYVEHSGTLNAPAVIILPFKENAVNDALMSLVINDPASANPAVYYQSPQTLLHTLRSLKIDLSDNPTIAAILGRLRGTEVEIAAPAVISGKILGVEYRAQTVSPTGGQTLDPWLSLITDRGIRTVNLMEVTSLNFKDPRIDSDLRRALDVIASARNSNSRDLAVNLPGNGSRRVSLSYVVPAPVWKVSYRLDFGQGEEAQPLFQGWAIIDNDGDSDWRQVELSLVAGRPASFIQNLYPPYYLSRPTLPLAIAGAAAGTTHDQGYAPPPPRAEALKAMPSMAMEMEEMAEYSMADTANTRARLAGGVIETASAAAAGDQFEFTIQNPVNLDRQMSAMLPLVETPIEARKMLIFSGATAAAGSINPRLGAELTNTSGMKLPAGPITVYDGGTYAGDALIQFWNEEEKRFISYGEDLSVTGTLMRDISRTMVSVAVSQGVMTLNRSEEFITEYTFKNNSSLSKPLLIEHPKNPGTVLESPEADEQTPLSYRFTVTLRPERELTVLVLETRPLMERISLLQIRPEAFLSYASSQEIPPRVKEALQQAVHLRTAVVDAESAAALAERRRLELIQEQDRIRQNLEAAGSQTSQGQEYLKRMMSIDNSIDNLGPEIERLRENTRSAQKALEDYLNNLKL